MAIENYVANWWAGKAVSICLESIDGSEDEFTEETYDEAEGNPLICMNVTWDPDSASTIATQGVKTYTFEELTTLKSMMAMSGHASFVALGTDVDNVTCETSEHFNTVMCTWFQPNMADAYSGLRRYSQGESYFVRSIASTVPNYLNVFKTYGVVELNEASALFAASAIVAAAQFLL